MPLQNFARAVLKDFIRRWIYLPEKRKAASGRYGECDFERIDVKTADGLTLSGLRSLPTGPKRFTLLYFHGNGGCAATRADLVSPFSAIGADIIVADYRGYGQNPGRPTEAGLLQDAEAFRRFALETTEMPIVLLGHSLGGIIAMSIAANEPAGLCGLLTLGTFASLRLRAPSYARPFLPDDYDGLPLAPHITIPWVIVHEEKDEVTPSRHAGVLYDASGRPDHVGLALLTGGTHSLVAGKLLSPLETVLNHSKLFHPRQQ